MSERREERVAGGRRPTAAGSGRARRGLVFGAGGVLGFAWMVGALQALEQAEGFDAREAEILVGTSAGAILAALVGVGVGADALVRHHQGIPLPGDPRIEWDYTADSGAPRPPRPGLALGSPDLLFQVARHPRQLPPLAAMSAVLPLGRGSLAPVGRMIDGLVTTVLDSGTSAGLRLGGSDGWDDPPVARTRAGRSGAGGQPAGEPIRGWPRQPATWLVAMDYDGGRRVAFGRTGDPRAELAAAVMASCAIPGWYAPVVIGGRRYVDGGTCSPTSLDLLAGRGLDEVWVLAPMASFAYDRPRSPVARLERRYRRTVTRRLLAEAALLRESGTSVTLLGPGPADLTAMRANLMNPARRDEVLATSLRTSVAALRREPAGAANTATLTPADPSVVIGTAGARRRAPLRRPWAGIRAGTAPAARRPGDAAPDPTERAAQ